MPTLYPYITRKHVNYDKNNVSRVPVRVKEDPKEFLYSKSYYKTLNNKVMNIPILIKEQPLKASPEKKEYWNLSVKVQLEPAFTRDFYFMDSSSAF